MITDNSNPAPAGVPGGKTRPTGVLFDQNCIEASLFEGVTLVSILLRTGHYTEAASLAGQLLVHFPQALPLHVGVGRALLASADEDKSGANILRATGHLRRVLDADPENWRVRLETTLLYLRSEEGQQERAGQELWLAAQVAPDNRWLRELIDRLPEHPFFARTQEWNKTISRGPGSRLPGPSSPAQPGQDEGGVARLYLRRKMPWMSVQYFEAALRRISGDDVSRADLKTGLLTALWLNGEVKRASALASEMLLDQPQLIMPRLLLTSHLSENALRNNPDSLLNLIEPVWEIDPFLVRSSELASGAGLKLPPGLWPRPSPVKAFSPSTLAKWEELGFMRPVRLLLGNLDRKWLESLLEASRQQDAQAIAKGGSEPKYHPHSEVGYSLAELENLLVSFNPGKAAPGNFVMPKGQPKMGTRSGGLDAEIDKIAASIAEVENLLYGATRRTSRPPSRPKKGASGAKPVPKGSAPGSGPGQAPGANFDPPDLLAGVAFSPNVIFQPQKTFDDTTTGHGLRQATALVVSSERALTSKYGVEGFRRIHALLQQLLDAMRLHGYDARLLLVDSVEALRRNGFERLDPVHAFQPEQVRDLINAALPAETSGPVASYPNTVFIIGGPDIIPFWRLPNPTFDSDREILSDNPYGARDHTYLLPERIVGRLPDDSGPGGDARLDFLLDRLNEAIQRQRSRLLPHNAVSSLPLRLIEAVLPTGARSRLSAMDESLRFEEEWLFSLVEKGEQFLDKPRSVQLSPFFYSAEAWKQSTETLRNCVTNHSRIILSPPTKLNELANGALAHSLHRARLLHFNLHGFQNVGNWYGQSQASRIVTSPSLSSLPVAFSPALSAQVQQPGTVVFSEACYGGYLAGKGVQDSIALSLLAQGSAVFVGSTVISYGSAGPELSCAGHLSYYFWKEVLQNGSSFGRALQAAKISYARERLAAGHNLTGDDAKTLLEFVLLGDPTIGMRAVVNDGMLSGDSALSPENLGSPNLMKGGLPRPNFNFSGDWQEEQNIRGTVRRLWGRLSQPKGQYQPIEYNKLPPDLTSRIEKILAWLLPDPLPTEGEYLKALIDMGGGSEQRPSSGRRSRHQKGGTPSGFADWFTEDENNSAFADWFTDEDFEATTGLSVPVSPRPEAQLLLTGQRPLHTADGHDYRQTFHLTTDITGEQIDVKLSKGKG